MEAATISNDGNSGLATYGRGYRPLLQEDPDISFTHGPSNTEPVAMQTLPPYTPEPQYNPAPQRFNPQHQSSSVSTRKINYTTTYIRVGPDPFLL